MLKKSRVYFSDLERELLEENVGIFDNGTLSGFEAVRERPSEDGSGFTFALCCQNCGHQLEVKVPWRELAEGALGVPFDRDRREPWSAVDLKWCSPARCSICNGGLPLYLSEGDFRILLARGLVKLGVRGVARRAKRLVSESLLARIFSQEQKRGDGGGDDFGLPPEPWSPSPAPRPARPAPVQYAKVAHVDPAGDLDRDLRRAEAAAGVGMPLFPHPAHGPTGSAITEWRENIQEMSSMLTASFRCADGSVGEAKWSLETGWEWYGWSR